MSETIRNSEAQGFTHQPPRVGDTLPHGDHDAGAIQDKEAGEAKTEITVRARPVTYLRADGLSSPI